MVPNYNVMGVAKAALEATVRYLASDLGPKNIRVNAISAGPVKTASARAIKDFSSILDVVAQHAPLRRNTDPAEVADTAVFLASDLGRGLLGIRFLWMLGFILWGCDDSFWSSGRKRRKIIPADKEAAEKAKFPDEQGIDLAAKNQRRKPKATPGLRLVGPAPTTAKSKMQIPHP